MKRIRMKTYKTNNTREKANSIDIVWQLVFAPKCFGTSVSSLLLPNSLNFRINILYEDVFALENGEKALFATVTTKTIITSATATKWHCRGDFKTEIDAQL